jgi:hypothetical protein
MATSFAAACLAEWSAEGTREALVKITWKNTVTSDKTLDLSSTNADGITGTWTGFSTISGIIAPNPYTPVAMLGYRVSATVSSTTATLNLTYEDYNAGADGPSIKVPTGATISESTISVLHIIGN